MPRVFRGPLFPLLLLMTSSSAFFAPPPPPPARPNPPDSLPNSRPIPHSRPILPPRHAPLLARPDRGLSKRLTKSRPSKRDTFTVYSPPSACSTTARLTSALEGMGADYSVVDDPKDMPRWVEELYEGRLPIVKHGAEAYVGEGAESYLDFFFSQEK